MTPLTRSQLRKEASRAYPTRSTPFPNQLLDTEMPCLSDTEWRILCVLVRQTLGWQEQDGGKRKWRDWLTNTQLKARTGRESAAISRAIQSLLVKRLIVVEDSEGKPLLASQQRQSQRGRLYFRLHPRIAPNDVEGGRSPNAFSDLVNEGSKKERNADKSENTKAKTTKESYYKNTPVLAGELESVQGFLALYQRRFQERSPNRLAPPCTPQKEGKFVRQLLEQYSYETLCDLLELFFTLEDRWVREQGYSLGAFRHRLPKLLMHPPDNAAPLTTRNVNWSKVESLLPNANEPKSNPKGRA
ncbi:MAG: hypothetical protein NT023_00075 [Armatimonadetes bacterium]|nr:hypothetical protein [Armatimonadota bacterium]